MEKITDERLILRNLNNVKITYIIQTIGLLCILGYEFFKVDLMGCMKTQFGWYLF